MFQNKAMKMIVIGMAAAVLTQAIKVSPQAKVLAKP